MLGKIHVSSAWSQIKVHYFCFNSASLPSANLGLDLKKTSLTWPVWRTLKIWTSSGCRSHSYDLETLKDEIEFAPVKWAPSQVLRKMSLSSSCCPLLTLGHTWQLCCFGEKFGCMKMIPPIMYIPQCSVMPSLLVLLSSRVLLPGLSFGLMLTLLVPSGL